MGRMKKIHKEIVDFKLTLEYVCPVNQKTVTVELGEYDLSASASPCELCGEHGDITIDVPTKCPSCGKYHNDITWKSW